MYFRMKKAEVFLEKTWKTFQKNQHTFPESVKQKFQTLLKHLQESLIQKDRERSKLLYAELKILSKAHFKKNSLKSGSDFIVALLFALCIAIVIRQAAFELYEIPSGSMRPTYKETDRLIVSKTQFGLNIPLTTSHLLFDPKSVKRMGVITFTGENMDIPNVKTNYFYIFPGYKQFIKRMIGLPGDTLYFYGGKIYGIDKQGNNISAELQRSDLSYLEHLPFINIEGKVVSTHSNSILIKQMNVPLAKLYLSPSKEVHYDLVTPAPAPNFDLHELFGMGNFAGARIISKENAHYLELTHHASASKAKIAKDPFSRTRPMLHTEKSYIRLEEDHLKTLWKNLYTGRFIIENNQARRYGVQALEARKSPYTLKIKAPDGMYEFYQGKLQQVKHQGTLFDVAIDHPLATFDVAKTILLFNAGIECDTRFLPSIKENSIPSSRYAYFRDGDLYVIGAPLFKKSDPSLEKFLASELEKVNTSSRYTPFIDQGPPTLEMIKTYGITVPEKHYFALGDNHAMSSDCRDFGFIPEDNLRGVPAFSFWAPGGRFGFQNHGIYPIITLPREISWTLLLAAFAFYKYRSRKSLRSLTFDMN